MKMIEFESVLKRANELYSAKKMKNHPGHPLSPRPEIESNQAKAALQALVEALNIQELLK